MTVRAQIGYQPYFKVAKPMHHPVNEDLEHCLDQAAACLKKAGRVAVLTGAGIAAESGLATFRGGGGLWEGHRVEDVATPMAFERDPALVWAFYNARRASLRQAQPNPGHHALTSMELRWTPERFTLITQNVDGLHRAAGSRNVLEIHGSLRWVRCTGCQKMEDRGAEPLPELPRCEACGELLRPNVVWFHESLPTDIWMGAENAARTCDAFLVIGTSAVVYPAAGLIALAEGHGAAVIEINLEKTEASRLATLTLLGPSGIILPRLLERM